ncbi:MAG: hypothetical protein K8T26_16065 [Lentisphaerae bacterium]|nr:hypothetical protein [Lentisphaerota bacterium]
MLRGIWGPGAHGLTVLCALVPLCTAPAASVREVDWAIHYNLPDQDTTAGTSSNPDEWAIRDALLTRVNALQAGQEGFLTTYTFSGSSDCCGAAGPILKAVNAALDRGAILHMVVDSEVSLTATNGGLTLAGLATRASNALDLEQEQDGDGIMHDKLGLFDYGPGDRWAFIASWNVTGGASSQQWNIALEARSESLFAACKAEVVELLAGRFHNVPAKSHAHDNAPVDLTGAWAPGRVRFSPCLDGSTGGNNALTDLTNAIAQAKQDVVFSLNKLTLAAVRDQLIQAANRGVAVNGVMPRSDTDPGRDSAATFNSLTNAANYTTTNVVHMHTAFARADGTMIDTGQTDLVHAKYMAIDPFGSQPLLIHGSANWTASALLATNANDETLVFIRHAPIARLFYAHFKQVTGALQDQRDFWMDISGAATGVTTRLWVTDTHAVVVQSAPSAAGPWVPQWTNTPAAAGFTATNAVDTPTRFYRAVRAP